MSEDGEEQEVGAEAIVVPINYKDRTYSQRIKDIRADKDKTKKATEALKALGFSVPVVEGIISITIFGKRELFENIFQIKLNRITSKGMDNDKNTFRRKSSFNYYVSDRNVKIPKELEGLVYDVLFSMEPTFM
jgi:5,10-methylenetetrahydrofolate reductase